MNSLFLALAVIVCGGATVQALDCYNCHHDIFTQDSTCLNSGWDTEAYNYTVETCSTGQVCQKSYDKIGGEVTSMDRRCVNEADCDNQGCVGAFSIFDCEFCCTDNLCNAGASVIISIITIVSAVLAGLIVKL